MNTIETITPAEATERLRAMGVKISPDVIREGIIGVVPFLRGRALYVKL